MMQQVTDVAGFQSGADYVIDVTGITGSLTVADFTTNDGAAQAISSTKSAPSPIMAADYFAVESDAQMGPSFAAHAQWATSTDGYLLA